VKGDEGAVFVRNTLLRNLREGSVPLPVGPDGAEVEVPIGELGISHPVLIHYGRIHETAAVLQSGEEETGGENGRGGLDGRRPPGFGRPGRDVLAEPPVLKLRRFQFVMQFSWVPTPPSERARAKAAADEAAAADAIASADGAAVLPE
jgi:hypothetical protein